MQAQASEGTLRGTPNLGHIADLVLEVGVATRLLYERFPGTQAVTPLYQYIEQALHEIRDELVKVNDQPR